MHLHILGIGGTFMAGLAKLARDCGHRVTGCDKALYPPMSDQLRSEGIDYEEGFDAGQIALQPDVFVIGNVVSRGNPLLEAILNQRLPYTSGPQWLGENVLPRYRVLAVAGTHGKTTTASMLAWIVEKTRGQASFLIGGIPANFGVSARLQNGPYFVIEADEYDTAFFDKRSKFLHYRPHLALLNNLEFDHADIFPDLAAIETQFHHLLRTVPGEGEVIVNGGEESLDRVIARGCWSRHTRFGGNGPWQIDEGGEVSYHGKPQGYLAFHPDCGIGGRHSQMNALAAVAAAHSLGISAAESLSALQGFRAVARRMERRGVVRGVSVYDDFAHHPSAIATTLAGARQHVKGSGRLIALVEPRSNTMKLGVMKAALPHSLAVADRVFAFSPPSLGWDLQAALQPLGNKAQCFADIDSLVAAVALYAKAGDVVVAMSNGNFENVHNRLLQAQGFERVGASSGVATLGIGQ